MQQIEADRTAGRADQAPLDLLCELAEVLEDARARLERCLAAVLPAAPVPAQRTDGRAAAVFRREGELWLLAYEGRAVRLRDSRGLRHLAQLLAAPNRPVHVLALAGGAPDSPGVGHDAAIEVLDAQARSSYRRRLARLEDELRDAERDTDVERRERCLTERGWLAAELSRALGLGGRPRTTGGSSERARTAVTKAVRSALRAVAEQHAPLGEHLSRTVRTGTYCTYAADPAPRWQV